MEGIDEAIARIAALAVAGANLSSEVMTLPSERPGVYALANRKTGEVSERVAAPGWHREELHSVDELKRFIDTYSTEESAVFVSVGSAEFVYDQGDRRSRAGCTLEQSEEFDWIRTKSIAWMNQAAFVRLLRITLARPLGANTGLLNLIRQIKFNQTADGESSIQHGKESMGRSITAKVMGIEAVPEEVQLSVRVFENGAPNVFSMRVAIEIDVQNQSFKLTPFPGQIAAALIDGMQLVRSMLASEDGPAVFLGTSKP